jgi:hypothetical protein
LKSYAEKVNRKEKIDPEITMQVQLLVREFKGKNARLTEIQQEFDSLYEYMAIATNAKVKIQGIIYPGVFVGISDMGMVIKQKYSGSQVYKDKGEVVIRPL